MENILLARYENTWRSNLYTPPAAGARVFAVPQDGVLTQFFLKRGVIVELAVLNSSRHAGASHAAAQSAASPELWSVGDLRASGHDIGN